MNNHNIYSWNNTTQTFQLDAEKSSKDRFCIYQLKDDRWQYTGAIIYGSEQEALKHCADTNQRTGDQFKPVLEN